MLTAFIAHRATRSRAAMAALLMLGSSPMLMAGSCATLGGATVAAASGVVQIAGAAPDISTNIDLACKSASGLAADASKLLSQTRVAAQAAKVSSVVDKDCGKVVASAGELVQILGEVNTASAILLAVAGGAL